MFVCNYGWAVLETAGWSHFIYIGRNRHGTNMKWDELVMGRNISVRALLVQFGSFY